MSLVPCPSCGKELSPQAKTCPHCGHPLEKGLDAPPPTPEPKSSKGSIILVLGLLAVIGWMFTGTTDERDDTQSQAQATTQQPRESVRQPDTSLEKMHIVFVGQPSVPEIKAAILPVMKMYGVAATEDGYSRAGSVLITMRKESGIAEIELLRCMETANQGGTLSFAEIAALCSITLQR
ncbi:zinc ribbon domain-containing protein [Pseudomonadota bacterium]